MRQPRERPPDRVPRLLPQRHEHRLHEPEHVLLPDERGLEVDLRELGLAVVAEVLVPEAARDLEVAVESAHQQQLVVDLGRLGERVELARIQPRRHEIVPGPLGGGLRQDGRLDLEELEIGERLPGTLQQAVAQHQVRLHLGTPQVEVAVLEAQLLRGEVLSFGARDGDGGRHGGPQDLELGGMYLHVARRELRVAHVGRACHPLAFHDDDRLAAEPARSRQHVRWRPPGAEGHLYQPCAVAQDWYRWPSAPGGRHRTCWRERAGSAARRSSSWKARGWHARPTCATRSSRRATWRYMPPSSRSWGPP